MRRLILTFLVFVSINTFSQTIVGTVKDATENIAFADVIIKNSTNKIIAGATTDDNGKFSVKVKEGTYTIHISFLGYESWSKQLIVTKNLNLGIITLNEDAETLDEVVVKTKKRVIQRKVDRLVFNVEKSIIASTGNGVDILKVSPRVQVQNGAIEIIGKGASRIMINGRISPLRGEELIDFLSGLGANEIKSVEVITNPPAKYEAAGNGGLINIILKKGAQNSWKNTTSLTYNQNKYNYASLRNSFFLNENKISLTASINVTKGSFLNYENLQITYPSNFWDIEVDNKSKKDNYSGRFLVDYEVSKTFTLGVQYLGNFGQPDYLPTTTSSIYNSNNQLEKRLVNKGDFDIKNTNNSFNFYGIKKFDNSKKNISFDVDYFEYVSDKKRDFITETFDGNNSFIGINSAGLNLSTQEIKNISSKIDVEYPFNKVNLSFGVKASFVSSTSNALFFNTITGVPVLDKNISNEFKYNENNYAGYISGNTKLNDKLELQFGLRIENTITEGMNLTINQINNNNYTKLFPTLYISYSKDDFNNFNFSYGKRISRPSFGNLNPFRVYVSDNSYSEGNPFLKPSFTDSFELSHSYKRNLISSVFFNRTNEGRGTVFTSNEVNQTQIVTRQNYYNQYNYGFTESFSYNKISWWESQNNITFVGYKTTFTKEVGSQPKNGFGVRVSSNNTFLLSENTKLQVNSWYNSKISTGLYSVGRMYNLSFGLQHNFKKSNIKMSIFANDILNTASLNNYESIVNGIKQTYFNNPSSRSIQLGISYDFGNRKVKENKRGFGNEDEKNRTQ